MKRKNNMKRRLKLTENALRNMVMEATRRVLIEAKKKEIEDMDLDELMGMFTMDPRKSPLFNHPEVDDYINTGKLPGKGKRGRRSGR
jgi:hypothetical protein